MFVVWWFGLLVWNDSVSMPIGLYVRVPHGRIIRFCPAEPYASQSRDRGYRQGWSLNCPDGGVPLLKPSVAKADDRVEVDEEGIWVNNVLLRNTVPLPVDSKGRTLEHWPYGRYSVAPGFVWVASSYDRRSYDSRYYGPVQEHRIQGHYAALWP